MQSLVKHLHAFATEVRLTESEWERAVQILTATGHITDDKRRSSSCGRTRWDCRCWSTRWPAERPAGAMESTVLGPFWTPDAPKRAYGESMIEQSGGMPAFVYGRVLDHRGQADRRRRARRVAKRRQRPVLGPGARRPRGPPARAVLQRRGRLATRSSACGRCRTPCRLTGPSARCWRSRADTRGGPRTST